jgi:hypothetical protein
VETSAVFLKAAGKEREEDDFIGKLTAESECEVYSEKKQGVRAKRQKLY